MLHASSFDTTCDVAVSVLDTLVCTMGALIFLICWRCAKIKERPSAVAAQMARWPRQPRGNLPSNPKPAPLGPEQEPVPNRCDRLVPDKARLTKERAAERKGDAKPGSEGRPTPAKRWRQAPITASGGNSQ